MLAHPSMNNISQGVGEYHYADSGTKHKPTPCKPEHKPTPCKQARNLRGDHGPKGGRMLQG